MRATKLFHRRTDGRIEVWSCTCIGSKVMQFWGEWRGAVQSTTHDVKGNSRQSAEERARHRYARLVKKRTEKGWVPVLDEIRDTVQMREKGDVNFDRLPKEFAPAKPMKTFDPDELAQLDSKGKLLVQRKRDGMRHWLVSNTNGEVHIYSSGKNDVSEHLKPLIENIQLPPRTILDVELVATNELGQDRFLTVSSIARSLPDRARKQIALAGKNGESIQLVAFDLLWWGGQKVYNQPYKDRYRMLGGVITDAGSPSTLVQMPLLRGLKKSLDMVKKFGWEGLVVWYKDASTNVRMNGSPDRLNCWKIKPVGEEDVVAIGYDLGKGRNSRVVGKLRIGFFDKFERKGMAFKPMGRCGTGLTDKDREEALNWDYPCVIQIEYDQKSEKGFRFPVFIRKRDDKKVVDCVG